VLLTPVTTLASPAVDPARVVWVAESGDNTYPLLSEALAAIDDASSLTPYVIKIAPGTYTETSPFALKTYVDVEGSGQGTTAIKCACSNASPGPLAATVSVSQYVRVEIRDLAITTASVCTRQHLLHSVPTAPECVRSNLETGASENVRIRADIDCAL
jgi:pectin methylesterase-like acyl-CoA thioesterase